MRIDDTVANKYKLSLLHIKDVYTYCLLWMMELWIIHIKERIILTCARTQHHWRRWLLRSEAGCNTMIRIKREWWSTESICIYIKIISISIQKGKTIRSTTITIRLLLTLVYLLVEII